MENRCLPKPKFELGDVVMLLGSGRQCMVVGVYWTPSDESSLHYTVQTAEGPVWLHESHLGTPREYWTDARNLAEAELAALNVPEPTPEPVRDLTLDEKIAGAEPGDLVVMRIERRDNSERPILTVNGWMSREDIVDIINRPAAEGSK